ncbi:carboxypeptidase regulatory-like domain-containing protein [Bremerella cremea]|uniref:Carboxypeptidase regulatory-like domain-containing protein n=1 Tax=Bremerella cremea TaxID=1031537 RepID=A0A368KX74_9BACT|nr:carboxypeptidase-like regulatory domain-containing protein [Bremerella cremea]RCS54054.1 carboxypeptidase regulatory-like domain-containing protein [Bremerella cremea]
MSLRIQHFSFAFLLGLAMIVGCGESGPSLGKVTGKVTLDGKPLPNAIVSFVPEDGRRSSSAMTNEEGVYNLAYIDQAGAVIGKHKVSITSTPEVQTQTMEDIPSDDPRYAEVMQSRQADYNNAKTNEKLPAVYNSKTELVYEVTSGSNTIDLPLTSDGKMP